MRSATKSRLLLPAHLDGGSGGGSTPGMALKQLWSQRKSLNLFKKRKRGFYFQRAEMGQELMACRVNGRGGGHIRSCLSVPFPIRTACRWLDLYTQGAASNWKKCFRKNASEKKGPPDERQELMPCENRGSGCQEGFYMSVLTFGLRRIAVRLARHG